MLLHIGQSMQLSDVLNLMNLMGLRIDMFILRVVKCEVFFRSLAMRFMLMHEETHESV